jgi:hypothetical protein
LQGGVEGLIAEGFSGRGGLGLEGAEPVAFEFGVGFEAARSAEERAELGVGFGGFF